MCGRFAQVFQTQDLEHIERTLQQTLNIDNDLIELIAANYQPSYNTPPTAHATIIHQPGNTTKSRPHFSQAHFGLIPSWSKDRSRAASMNNARSETITAKPSFRNLYRSSRCLIPITGFYEWQPISGSKTKQPWYIHRADAQPLMLAGIWDTWLDPEHGHSEVDTFSIITTKANSFMADIHHRMPVIVEPESIRTWFDRTAEPRQLEQLLTSSPAGIVTGHRVSKRVNTTTNNDPSLIEPDTSIPPSSLWG